MFLLAALSSCSNGSNVGAPESSKPSSPSALSSQAVLPRIARAPTFSASTVPGNGDLNPYGIAFVPSGFPGSMLSPGDVVVANFNNSNNAQGTGTTIVRVRQNAPTALFFGADVSLQGFSTALGVLSAGFVLVGNVPSIGVDSGVCHPESFATDVGQGALTIIDSDGVLVTSLVSSEFLNGPWDLTVSDRGSSATVFVSNVRSGTVSRLDLTNIDRASRHIDVSFTEIAHGYSHRCDDAAFVIGPTGLAYDAAADVLYVASTTENTIYGINGARVRSTDILLGSFIAVAQPSSYHGPLGLVIAPGGDLISAQGDAVFFDKAHPSVIVEVTSAGTFVQQFSIDRAPGSAFGVALNVSNGVATQFAAVDDGLNVLDIWDIR
jgi:hypothetical protein